MSKSAFLSLISSLKEYFSSSSNKEKIELFVERSMQENPWFTKDLIEYSMSAIQNQFFKVETWNDFYNSEGEPNHIHPKKVGLILPGNLPAVGMHDVLMVLASGNACLVKLSSQDKFLMTMYIQAIQELSQFEIQIVDKMANMDLVIATGSDFAGNYFTQYFKDIPHIIRKNRSSIAVLTGNENSNDFHGLAKDIFTYYGLGCRNVSSIFVPKDYDLMPLFDVLTTYQSVMDHNKYGNNYQYQKTLMLLNQVQHFDLGNLLVVEKPELVSAVGVLHLHYYENASEIEQILRENNEKVQCVVGTDFIDFGQAQEPGLSDFADGINTYKFINNGL
ncbi:MAG: acyl-CoA reductase [Aquirufa sp.]